MLVRVLSERENIKDMTDNKEAHPAEGDVHLMLVTLRDRFYSGSSKGTQKTYFTYFCINVALF